MFFTAAVFFTAYEKAFQAACVPTTPAVMGFFASAEPAGCACHRSAVQVFSPGGAVGFVSFCISYGDLAGVGAAKRAEFFTAVEVFAF